MSQSKEVLNWKAEGLEEFAIRMTNGSLAAVLARHEAQKIRALQATAVPAAKRWPFVESPGSFASRMEIAISEFNGDMLAAVRHCLIENPAVLAAAPVPAPAIPAGWKLVPVEPTEAMLKSVARMDFAAWDQQMPKSHYEAIYAAFLQAASNE